MARTRSLEPVSFRGKVSQTTTGACVLGTSLLTVWSAWAELTCPYGGPAGREYCRTTVGVGGLFVMFGLLGAAFGAVVLWTGVRRPIEPHGGAGWTWGEGALVFAAGLVLGLMVIDSPVCPGGYQLAIGFPICILEANPATRIEATSMVWLQAATVAGAALIGIVIAAWRRVPAVLGAILVVAATAAGTVWFVEDTVGLPW